MAKDSSKFIEKPCEIGDTVYYIEMCKTAEDFGEKYIDFAKVKNITLGYTFPKKWMEKARIENLRLYLNFQNIYTFTKYKGYDPEVGASTQDSTGLTFGLDNGRYPAPTMYSFGLNITF